MKTAIIGWILVLHVSFLYAESMSMKEFRVMQRQLVLSDFKALYKQRHILEHKAQLKRKYHRVKKMQTPSMLNKLYSKHDIKSVDSTETTQNSTMQIKANHDIEYMKNMESVGSNQPKPIFPSQLEPIQPSQPEPTQPSQPEPTQPSQPEPIQPTQPVPTQPSQPEPTATQPALPTLPMETGSGVRSLFASPWGRR